MKAMVVSPARSLAIISEGIRDLARQRLESLGFQVEYSKHSLIKDEFDSSPAELRAEDLNSAFSDKEVTHILTAIGGYNSIEILDKIDYGLIARNRKFICGFSDITVILNAIHAKTGMTTFYGPHFSSFGMKYGIEYTIEMFMKAVRDRSWEIYPSTEWSDDPWYLDQEKREFMKNEGYWSFNGDAEGRVVGGHLRSFSLLFGTEYMPDLRNSIVLIETTLSGKEGYERFVRRLNSLRLQDGADEISGLIIGRFLKSSGFKRKHLEKALERSGLSGIPAIGNVDLGHTTPIATFPIGGKIRIEDGVIRVLDSDFGN